MFEYRDKTKQIEWSSWTTFCVAAVLQCSSNKQGIICEVNRLVNIPPPSVAYSKENCGSYRSSSTVLNFRYKELTTCLQMEELRENYEHILTGCKNLYLNFCLTSVRKKEEKRP